MRTQVIDWFRKPFPLVESIRDILLISLGSGVVVVSFLIIFHPFGIETVKGIFLYLCGFGLIDFAVTAMNLFLWPRIFPSIINNTNWTTGKNLLFIFWILFTIALINFVYGEYLVGQVYVKGLEQLNRTGILSWIFMTFSVGVIPVVFALYFIEKSLVRRNEHLAEEFNKGIRGSEPDNQEKRITIQSGRDTSILISSTDLICVQAEGGNYASVYWLDESGINKEMIRMTLAGFLKKTNQIDSIVRCHKSYVINLNKVLSYRGNARSVTIKLDGLDFDVPVSRSFPREELIKHT